MKDQRKAYLYALLVVLLWSTVPTAFKLSLRRVDYVQLLFYSSLFSSILLGLILAARGRLRSCLSALRRDYARSLGLGFLNPFLYYLVLFRAYELLPAQMAQPLNYTWAIALALLSIPLLGQKLGPRGLLGGLLSYVGVWVISTRGDVFGLDLVDPLGVALALGSAFIWAFYWIRNTRDERDPVERLFMNFVMSLPLVFVACAALSGFRLESPRALALAAYVGVVEMGLTFVLWLKALRLASSAARVGYLIFVAPFLSFVLIHFVLGELILPSTYLGLVLIIVGLTVQRQRWRRRPQ
ncbi:MAG: EamA family transporter [Candidatus Eisenbacteria bacterium]|nr:EamA family transporter [Candidatus Eisenbacteria bacterium]